MNDEDRGISADDLEDEPRVDDSGGPDDECPTCGNEDIQSAELLEAWKEIRDLKGQLLKAQAALPVDPNRLNVAVPMNDLIANRPQGETSAENVDWKARYEKIKSGYIKTRLEVSGSFGNWDYATRKRVLENEISAELGFKV